MSGDVGIVAVLLLLFTPVVLLVLHILQEPRGKRKKIEKSFARRPSLDGTTFYRRYFEKLGVSEAVTLGVREILEKILETNLARLNDSDDFKKNLKFFSDFDSLADINIIMELEKRFDIAISDQEVQAVSSIRDIVILVDRKVKAKAA